MVTQFSPVVGILAIQGDFAAHATALARCGCKSMEIRSPGQLDEIAGLIMPGGESTTMLKFFERERFVEPLLAFNNRGGAFFGTCAGAILLAKEVSNPAQYSLGILDIAVQRNGYGRQIDSFITSIHAKCFGDDPLEAVFIRAPIIERIGTEVEVLAEHQSHPVLVRQGRHFAATFHPELTTDSRVHEMFVESIRSS